MTKRHKIFLGIRNYYASMGFKYKLMLFCLGIVIIPALMITALYTNQLSNTLEEQSIKNATYELNQTTEGLKSSVTFVEEFSNQIFFNNSLSKELLKTYVNKGDSAAIYVDVIKPLLDLQSLHRKMIAGMTIFTENETILADEQNIIFADDYIKSQDWYMQSKSQENLNQIIWQYRVNEDGIAYYSLYRDLNSYIGNSAGVLRIDVFAEYLNDLAKSEGQDSWILLEDKRETVQNEDEIQQLIPDYLKNVISSDDGSYDISEQGQHYKIIFTSFIGGYSPYLWKTIVSIPIDVLMNDVNTARNTALLLGIAAALLLSVIIIFYANGMTKRINHLAVQTGKVMDGNFNFTVDVEGRDEIGQLGESFNEMLNYLDNLVNEVYENKIKIQNFQLLQKESELKALQNKINPHFLYNTLDAIRFRAIIAKNEELADMMVSLSRLLSYSINNKSDIVTLDKELEHVNSYINLMKVRYEDRLEFSIQVDESLHKCLVNKLILQPLVENSIYHGIRQLNTKGHINVSVDREGDNLIIRVADDGKGISKDRLVEVNKFEIKNNKIDKVEIGLKNVHERIKLFFGDEYGLHVDSELGIGTTVVLTLPYKQEGELDV